MDDNKNKFIIIGIIVFCIIVLFLIIYISNGDININIYNEIKPQTTEPIVKKQEEETVNNNLKLKIIKWLPFVYTEASSPFSTNEIIDITLDKILENSDLKNFDLSEEAVNRKIKDIFGDNVSVDKTKVSIPDTSKSIYYYNNETLKYEVIPMGFMGLFKYQIVKEITSKEDMIYVYTYVLIGSYSYEEDVNRRYNKSVFNNRK